MKTLKLFIDLKDIKLSNEDKKLSPIEMSTLIIKNTILTYAQQVRGLNRYERKQYYIIDKIFADAIKNKLESVNLEDNDFGFIRKCFREVKLTPTELLAKVEENIDAVIDR